MSTSTLMALVLAGLLAAPVVAAAQTTPYHHSQVHRLKGPHHAVHHRFAAPAPTPVAAPAAPAANPFGLSLPHVAPYPDGKGDEDGLSEDPDDCNKGCIDGNTPD